MAITVRNDVDPNLMGYLLALQGQAKAQRQQSAGSAQAAPPALTMSGFKQLGSDGDRAALAAKQRQKYGPQAYADSYAGANWQMPITIWNDEKNGVKTGKVVYENAGADPLASGAMGALGTRETIINDPNKLINTRDPEDMAKLGQVVKGLPQGGDVPGDYFQSDQERADAEAGRKFAQQANLLDYKASIDEQKAAAKAKTEQAVWEYRKQFEESLKNSTDQAEKLRAAQTAIQGYKALQSTLPSGDPQDADFDPSMYTAEDRKRMKELRDGIDMAFESKANDIDKAHILGQLFDALKTIKPVRKPQVEGEARADYPDLGVSFVRTPDGRYVEVQHPKLEQPKPQKPAVQLSPQQYAALEKQARGELNPLNDPEMKIPPEKIAQKVQEYIERSQAVNQQYAPPAPLPPRDRTGVFQVSSLEQVGALPSGSKFRDPNGVLRMVP